MARTTLNIQDDLLRRLKEKAAREGRPMQDVANDLLRQGLAERQGRKDYHLALEGWQAEALPGVDILDRDNLFDRMTGQ